VGRRHERATPLLLLEEGAESSGLCRSDARGTTLRASRGLNLFAALASFSRRRSNDRADHCEAAKAGVPGRTEAALRAYERRISQREDLARMRGLFMPSFGQKERMERR